MHKQMLLLTLNSKEAVDWIMEVGNKITFMSTLSKNSHIRSRTYNLIVLRVPLTFEPRINKHLWEVEEVNGLGSKELSKAKWIKPIRRRRPDQTHTFAIFSMASVGTTNTLIRDGLNICGMKVRPKKQKLEPIQCMKCRCWGHFTTECPSKDYIYGTYGEAHQTNTYSDKGKVYCVSYGQNTHPSWDRNCPEFYRRCTILNKQNPENVLLYFLTDQDWTFTMRPERIPMNKRFPTKYTVNSLPLGGNRQSDNGWTVLQPL